MNRYKVFGLLSLIILATVLVLTGTQILSESYDNHSGINYLNQSELSSINVTGAGVTVSQATSTIYVNSSADLPVMMGPMNSRSMYSFEIFGIVNPNIVMQSGVTVQFTVVNVDSDAYHNFVLSNSGPPYSYYMDEMGMMNGYENGYGYMSMMPYLPPAGADHYAYMNISYSFSSAGNYWYLCTYSGHAQNGMYGRITVT